LEQFELFFIFSFNIV